MQISFLCMFFSSHLFNTNICVLKISLNNLDFIFNLWYLLLLLFPLSFNEKRLFIFRMYFITFLFMSVFIGLPFIYKLILFFV